MRPEEREGRDTESSGGSNGRNRSVGGLKREREREKKVSLSPLAPRRTDGKRKRKRRAESKLPPSLFFLASFLPLAASVAISHHSERKFSIHSMPPGRKKEGERLTERGKQEEDSTACEGNASAAKQSGATGRSAMAEGVVLYLPLSLSRQALSFHTRSYRLTSSAAFSQESLSDMEARERRGRSNNREGYCLGEGSKNKRKKPFF